MPTGELVAQSLAEIQRSVQDPGKPSFNAVLGNKLFRALWIAQICSQLAQNTTWIALGAYVAAQTHKTTFVAIVTVSAMLAQLFLSGFAGVMVDRADKRNVLLGSNIVRVVLTLFLVGATHLDVGIQTTAIIVLIFIVNAIAQFFAPAEAATIPRLVERRDLIAATSLFNITMNACQVVPIIFGLVLLQALTIVPVLLLVAMLYVIAAALVSTLPAEDVAPRRRQVADSLGEAASHVIGDISEALRFLSADPGLRLTIFQINVAPTFLFVFGALGLNFVHETFNLNPDRAYILLLPAGLGLVMGALLVGPIAARRRKEDLINLGLLVMGVGVAVLGAVSVIVRTFDTAAGHVGNVIAHLHRFHHLPHAPAALEHAGLIPPAILIAFVIGFAMALSTIPAQTLVLERTSEEVRGRVLSMQNLIGGAIPIIPLLTVGPLADIFGNSAVMTGLGIVIVLVGAFSVRLDRTFYPQA